MTVLRLLTASAVGYLVGTLPSADVASRVAARGRVDLRASGSRNPGGVNAFRLLGSTAGRAVIVVDVLKGFTACSLGKAAAGDNGAHVAGVSAVLGHCYPAWNGFRGGKGIATSFGQCLYTFPAAAPMDIALAIGIARIPGLRRKGLVSTAVASGTWLAASLVWWKRRLPNSWGPPPSLALPLANAATLLIIGSRFALALRRGHSDDLEVRN
ncbi:MAG: glycerol-3-phosphate acyltransferase [Gaiellaceae bacterium]